MMNRRRKAFLLISTTLACAPCAAFAAQPPAGQPAVGMIQEVIVTARRREEALSQTPVAITAFTGEKLAQQNVHSTQDLQRLTPGVVFGDTGSQFNVTYSIRGQGKFVIGGALPAVLSYFNEVPLGATASILPTFDMSNVQVLKGPQGTLFGRNTTGGAVLVYSQPPKYEYGGYVEGLYGDNNWRGVQGAINVPLIPDKLAIRVAGDFARRDGDTKNLGVGGDMGDVHYDALRASILFEPTDYIKNTTVYDHYYAHDNGRATMLNGRFSAPDGERQYQIVGQQYAGLDALFGTNSGGWPNCGTSPYCDVNLAIQQQLARGPRVTETPSHAYEELLVQGVSNTTQVDVAGVTLKNIFGWRRSRTYNPISADGLPFILENVQTDTNNRQITEEVQVSGQAFKSRLDWIVGGFYFRNTQPGPNVLAFDAYRNPTWYPTPASPTPNLTTLFPIPGALPAGVPMSAFLGPYNPGSAQQVALFTDTSAAGFAQGNYHFGGDLEGLSFTLGLRYTADSQEACSKFVQPIDAPKIDGFDACRQTPGASTGKANSNALTWQLGLDYKLSNDVFLYAVARKGYKGGGLNTPELGGTLAQFQTYRPQKVTDFEIGAKTRWRAGTWTGSFNLAAFNSKYKDLQRAITGLSLDADGDNNPADDPSFQTLYINTESATARGVEVDGVVIPFPDLTLGFAGSYLDYTVGGDPPPAALQRFAISGVENAPKWSYTLAGDYRLPFGDSNTMGDFFAHADYYWVSNYNVGVVRIDKHGILNLSLDWRKVLGQPVTASLFVQNATDKVYVVSATLSGTAPGFQTVGYAPPRLVGFRLRYTFGGG